MGPSRKIKTRTGCKTCKFRRVKCDEGKPSCARCLKFGVCCEGYESVGSRCDLAFSERSSTHIRQILPRTGHVAALLPPSSGKLPFINFFLDEREYKYFLHFQQETALELAGPFEASLWNHVVLQGSQNEPCLCRLTASIGALSKSIRLRDLGGDEAEANLHLRYALMQYGRAIKSIHLVLSTGQKRDLTRIALIASLLIYCFENMNGDGDSAIRNMRSALELMRKQLSQTSRRYIYLENTSPTPRLEDALVAAFVRVDNNVLSRLEDTRPNILDIDYKENLSNVPYRFKDIAQARRYLENFQFRDLPRLAKVFAKWVSKPQIVDKSVVKECEAIEFDARQWNSAFAHLYAASLTPAHTKDFIAATTLRAQGLTHALTAHRVGGKMSIDFIEDESREIVDLTKIVVADPSFRKGFVFECGIVPGLFMVVVTSLHMHIRQEALEILKQVIPRREGTWDSLILSKLAEKFLQMENAAMR